MKSQKPLLCYLGNKKQLQLSYRFYEFNVHEVTTYNYILVIKEFKIVYLIVDTNKSLKVPILINRITKYSSLRCIK